MYHSFYTRLSACEDGTECSETSAYKLQAPGNYPKESIQQVKGVLFDEVVSINVADDLDMLVRLKEHNF
jgi:hypothetical protein